MQKNRKIKIDFSNSRSRLNQRSHEATLVVGKKATEDTDSANTPRDRTNTLKSGNGTNNDAKNSANGTKNPLLMRLGRLQVPDDPSATNNSVHSSDAVNDLPQLHSSSAKPSISYKPVIMTVKFHELRTSPDTVLIDPKLVPGAKVGDIGEIQCISGTRKKFYFTFKEFKGEQKGPRGSVNAIDYDSDLVNHSPIAHANSEQQCDPLVGNTNDENTTSNNSIPNSPNSVISILSGPIVTALDLKPRTQVTVTVKPKDAVEADTIEIYVKDIHLSRGDMWNISNLLVNRCTYKSERISFINGSIRLNINRIYRNGHLYFSSYIGENTKFVFRSDSARLVVFIQISSEMWHFEESGQQMFHKLVNSFFPKAFQKWKDLETHHLITIILFSSVDLDGEKIRYSEGETPPNKTDYYRVVVDQVHILLWNEIMATLRLEFANFKRDVYLHKKKQFDFNASQEYLIQGSILPAAKGSILEAINLGMSLVSDDFKDPTLRQTNNHFIMITPGTGLFDVSYDMLIRTSRLMTTVDSTLDIICLSQPPLHIVPLFRYLDNQNRLKHCIPSWLDISFWTDSSQAVHQWLPKCKIYELQMMGVMENELSSANINDLCLSGHKSAMEAMEAYDRDAFTTSVSKKSKKVLAKPKLSHHASSPSMRIVSNNSVLSESKDDGLKSVDLIVSSNKSSAATCNAFGVTTTSKPNVSAFSQLLSLSQNTETKTVTSSAYNFVRKMISTPILSPLSSSSEQTSSSSSGDLNSDPMSLADSSNIRDSVSSIPISKALKNSSNSSIRTEMINSNRLPSKILGRTTTKSIVGTSKSDNANQRQMKALRQKKSKTEKEKNNKYMEERDSISNSYWTNIGNPSNRLSTEVLSMISYGRWRFVFPPNIKRRAIKWNSLSSPATLPLMTTIFPTLSDFNQNYTFRIYDVLLNQSIMNENQTSKTLLRKMITLRLSLGFQICIGEKVEKVEKHRKPNGDSKLLIKNLTNDNFIGSRVYLSLGNEIHRICCDFNGLLNVQVYKRIASTDEQLTLSTDKEYIENIRTRYSEEYLPIKITSSANFNSRNYNWNQLDQVLAGYEESIDKQKYHRMKFVVLPADVPENAFSLSNEKLTTEEIRLEGIRSLIMNIYKIRFRTLEEKKSNKRLEISPEMYFYTDNLFDYLRNESNPLTNSKWQKNPSGFEPMTSPTGNGSIKSHQYNMSIDLHLLVSILQSDDGIPIVDRHWHLKFYRNCFLGMDLVNFLLENFDDIETREAAVEFGNKLMEQKVISHVVSKHNFLDGHYFYYLNRRFTEDSNNKVDSPVDTLMDDNTLPIVSDETGEKSKTIMLSKEVLCDLDPNEYSWKPELVKVHYDIVHNPDHCFHLRIEWLDTTSKLIEDLINGWSKYCERYGLMLVEVPWDELFILPIRNPLHSTIEIQLKINPWEDAEFQKYDKIFKKEKYFFHLYLLKVCSFMLDNRTANYFKDDKCDVVYSWGKPMFKYAQFIHLTGGYIAELRNNGDFFLAPNNEHISRLNLNIGKLHNLGKSKAIYFDSQSVMLEFRSICTNEMKLRELFREAVSSFENDEAVM